MFANSCEVIELLVNATIVAITIVEPKVVRLLLEALGAAMLPCPRRHVHSTSLKVTAVGRLRETCRQVSVRLKGAAGSRSCSLEIYQERVQSLSAIQQVPRARDVQRKL